MKLMCYPRMARNVRAAMLIFCVLLAANSISRAGTIEYKWRGTIEPLDVNEDPWQIGAGKPYTISAFVDEDAVDIDAEVGGAFFKLTDAELLIDGAPPSFYSGGSIWFRELATSDTIFVRLDDVEFRGVREEFFIGAWLETSTFTFTNMTETPPLFSRTMTISPGGATSESSSYFTLSGPDRTVTAKVIPEPSTMVLALFALLGVGVTRWRNRAR